MADNLRWFKVWTTIASDPHFQEMSLEDMGRWIVLGALTAAHGVNGKLPVTPNATVICRHMNCTKDELKVVLKRLPNIIFEEGKTDYASGTVTWKNWHKYQRDSTVAQRVKALRSKRRGEERREEEKRSKDSCSERPGSSEPAISPYIISILEECKHLKCLSNGIHGDFWDNFLGIVEPYKLDSVWLNSTLRRWNQWFEDNPTKRSRSDKRLRSRLLMWLDKDLDQQARRK